MRDMGFFMESSVESTFEEVEIAGIDKFKYPTGHEKVGQKIPWILKGLSTDAMNQLRDRNTIVKLVKGKKERTTDDKRLTYEMMVDTIVYPNFKDSSWLDSVKCIDPIDLLKKVLDKPLDFGRISNECCLVNGIGVAEEELVEDAKN